VIKEVIKEVTGSHDFFPLFAGILGKYWEETDVVINFPTD